MHPQMIAQAIIGEVEGLELQEWDMATNIANLVDDYQTDRVSYEEALDQLTEEVKSSEIANRIEEAIIERLGDMIKYNE